VSEESARQALEYALETGDQAGISPTVHGLTTQQLWHIADGLLTERNARDRLKIAWHTDGSLTFEELPRWR
jgi:hypothetical protein